MKREFLLFLVVLLLAIAAVAVLFVTDSKAEKPAACFMHGGSSTGDCKS